MERNTLQRSIVLKTVTGMRNHPSADMVFERIARDYPGIGRATVFRLLRSLAEEGLVQKLCMSTTADRFDFTLTPHAHIVCRCCGRVEDYPEPQEHLASLPKTFEGFDIEHKDIIYRGVCSECKGD